MTEILVTTQTTPDAPPPPAAEPVTPATPEPGAAAPDAPAAKTPEQIAADTQLQADRKEVREIAEAQARAWKAQQESKHHQARIAELEGARKADLERIARVEAQEAIWKDPSAVLAKLEENGLTAQQLGKAVLERGTPEEILAKARKIAGEEADLRLKKVLDERDGVAKKIADERARTEAIHSWEKGIVAAETDYPATSAMLAAGPMLRELVHQQAFRIYALAADEAKAGRSHSDEEINKSLESFLAKEYGSLTERRSAAAQKPSAANGTSESAKSAAAAPNVTDARANDLATLGGDLPKDFGDWSTDKQNKWFIDKVTKR